MAACTKKKAEEAYPFLFCFVYRRSPIPYQHSKQDEKETLEKQKLKSKELKQGRSMFDSYYQTNVDNEPISVKSNFYE